MHQPQQPHPYQHLDPFETENERFSRLRIEILQPSRVMRRVISSLRFFA